MSYERVLKALVNLGLKPSEAAVYVFLATTGSSKAMDIAKVLKIYKQQLYRCLNCLRERRIVNATSKRPALYSAVPFPTALDLFMKAKEDEAQSIDRNRDLILSYWQSMMHLNSRKAERFSLKERRV